MKLLLVEDDRFFQNFYATKLRESNFVISVASDGLEGLQKLKEERFNLVLLDLIMPKLDGFGVLEQKAKDESVRDIPVIIFSTLGQESDIEKAKKLGAKEYMNKTFYNFPELLEKINALVK